MKKTKKSLHTLIAKMVDDLLREDTTFVDPRDVNGIVDAARKYQEMKLLEQYTMIKNAMYATYIVLGVALLYRLL